MEKEFTGPRSHKGWETLVYAIGSVHFVAHIHLGIALSFDYDRHLVYVHTQTPGISKLNFKPLN